MWLNNFKVLIPNYNGSSFIAKTITNLIEVFGKEIEIVGCG